MRAFLSRCALTSAFFISSALVAQPINFNDLEKEIAKIDRSLELELNQEGFQTVSEIAYDSFLKDMKQFQIPNQEFSIISILKASIGGITVDADWESLSVEPSEAGIKASVGIRNLNVNVKEITLSNYILPFLKTTCKDTTIKIGNNNPLVVETELGVAVQNHQFYLNGRSLDFEIEANQYAAEGPRECRGLFGIRDYLSQFVFGMVIKLARGMIAKEVKKQFNKVIPGMQKLVNDNAKLMLPIDLEEQLIIPETQLALHVFPFHLNINNQRLAIELGVKVKDLPYLKEEPSFVESNQPKKIASIGFNPELINKLLAAMYVKGGPEFEINADMNEMIGQILRTTELAYFWPDLEKIKTDSEEMVVQVSLGKAPVIKMNPETSELNVTLNDLRARFEIFQDNQWKDYFTMGIDFELNLGLDVETQTIILNFKGKPLAIRGQWASTYTPVDPTFDEGAALALIGELAQFGFEQLSPVSFKMPVINAMGQVLTLNHVRVEEPFLKIDLQKHN